MSGLNSKLQNVWLSGVAWLVCCFVIPPTFADPVTADMTSSSAGVSQPHPGDPLSRSVSLTFKEMKIVDAVKVLSEDAGVNMAVSDGVQGSVTVFLTDVELRTALEVLAELTGNAYIQTDGVIQIVTGKEYESQFGVPFATDRTLFSFALTHASSGAILAGITQLGLLTEAGRAWPDASSNSIVVWDSVKSRRRIAHLVATLDRPVEVRKFPLQTASAVEVLEPLQKLLEGKGKAEADTRTNSIIVSGTEDVIGVSEDYLKSRDDPRRVVTEIVPLSFSTSDTSLTVLRDKLTTGIGRVELLGRGDRVALTDLPSKLPELRRYLGELDTQDRQVNIEVKILQVALQDEESMGVNWRAVEEKLNELDARVAFPVLPKTESGNPTSGAVLEIGNLEKDGYNGLIEAIATYGKTEIVSQPQMTVMSGHNAFIHVGSTEPFITVNTRESQGTINTFEEVTQIEVGVKLDIAPVVHPNDYISMRIQPEVSSVSRFVTSSSGNTIPVVEESSMDTHIRVKDGIHIVLGGLIKEELRETESYVPVLGKIPILGHLFRSKTTKKVKTELVLIVWPRIVTGDVAQTR